MTKYNLKTKYQTIISRCEPNESGCIVWAGPKTKNGYGQLGRAYVHRIAYVFYKGEIPNGLEIDHTCGNRACCNIEHLEAVSHMVNIQRGRGGKSAKERMSGLKRNDRNRKQVCYYLASDVIEAVKKAAQKEGRSVNNFVEVSLQTITGGKTQ